MTAIDRRVADFQGEAAPPRRNGELMFAAPWEGRAFGMAVALHEQGAYAWDDFRRGLVEEIAGGRDGYYESWLAAFEKLLVAASVLTPGEISERTREYQLLERDPVF